MILRPIALFLGVFSLLNLALDQVVPGFDANIWWIDFRLLPGPLPGACLAVSGGSLLAYAALGAPGGRRRWALAAGLLLPLAFVAHNTVQFYALVADDAIRAGFPVPLSLLLLVPLAAIVRDLWRGRPADAWSVRRAGWKQRGVTFAVLVGMVLAFPVAQMLCFGCTDYRRPADVAVVFGARAYASGRMSTSLHDRTRTGVELYRRGLVRTLIVSGGPGDGDVHETEAMRRYALANGVPDAAIVRDEDGLDTQHTVRNTVGLLRARGSGTILAVSQFYHLPRIKLTYLRAGIEVYTVPAPRSEYIPSTPYSMAREVAALWFYYFRPLLPGG